MKDVCVVKKTRNGMGLFASKAASRGSTIMQIKGKILPADYVTNAGGKLSDNAFRFGPQTYLSPAGKPGDYLNHSCKPNCGVRKAGGKLYLIAIERIRAGTELTFDYSTVLAGDDIWKMTCNCGKRGCRRVVKKFKSLPRDLRERYIELGVVPAYILNI